MAQVFSEGVAQVVPAQGVLDGSFQKAQFIARIVAKTAESISIDRFPVSHEAQGISELDFAALARLDTAQDFKDIRRQDIAA